MKYEDTRVELVKKSCKHLKRKTTERLRGLLLRESARESNTVKSQSDHIQERGSIKAMILYS